MITLVKKAINRFLRKLINQQNRARLTNHGMTVISSNCNGAFILHDLGEKFHSPFVNLYLLPDDFIKYLQNIEHYMQAELRFETSDKAYPVGKLDDLTIHFMHYHSEEEAKAKWTERTARMNLDNLFILMTDRDGCTRKNLEDLDRLPFANKVIFTHKAYPEFASACYIKGFEQQGQVGDLFEFSGWNGRKYYDELDYVNWFNTGKR